jgi:hypothetical protein
MIDPAAGRPDPVLFPDTTTVVGSNVVLLAAGVNTDGLTPDLFADIGTAKPTNQVVMGEFLLLDYGDFQCFVLPGEPRRLQLQSSTGTVALIAHREYARRLFKRAIAPSRIGMNFQRNVHIGDSDVLPLADYLRIDMLQDLIGRPIESAGFTTRFEHAGWRCLLTVGPGASTGDLIWQLNFERAARTERDIDEAIDAMTDVAELEANLSRRIQWRH